MPCGLSVCQTQHALPARGSPVEGPRERLAAGQVRRRAGRPVVRDREVAHAAAGEHERQARRAPRHVGLHRGDDLEPVATPELLREAKLPRELVDRRRLGVHGERERADLEAAAADEAEERVARGSGPRCEPALQRQVALDRPVKAVVAPRRGRARSRDMPDGGARRAPADRCSRGRSASGGRGGRASAAAAGARARRGAPARPRARSPA